MQPDLICVRINEMWEFALPWTATVAEVAALFSGAQQQYASFYCMPDHIFLDEFVPIATLVSPESNLVILSMSDHLDIDTTDSLELDQHVSDVYAQGAFGKVFRGRLTSGAFVAIKQLHSAVSLKASPNLELLREASILKTLRHPCIVKFFGITSMFGELAIVTGFCNGGTLRSWSTKAWSVVENWKVAHQICNGLWYLHSSPRPIIHGDLKPDNVLVMEINPPRIKIADFGLSRLLGKQSSVAKMFPEDVICVPFAAPETISQARIFSKESDIWSYGMVLYEMFSFHVPYVTQYQVTESKDSWKAVRNMILQGTLPSLIDSIPMVAWRLMNDCWKLNRKERVVTSVISKRIAQILTAIIHHHGGTSPKVYYNADITMNTGDNYVSITDIGSD
jgi:serine/threonine protein kinase